MTRLKQAWLALCVVALVGCDEPIRERSTVLVCSVEGRETYRSEPEVCWKLYSDGRRANCGWTKAYRQSADESCRAEAAQTASGGSGGE